MNFVLPPFRDFGTAHPALVAYPTCASAENKPKHAGASVIVIQVAEVFFQASADIKKAVRDIVVAHAARSLHEGGEVSTTLADEAGAAEQNSWL